MNGILVESYLLKKWPEPKYERKDDSLLLSVTVNHRGIWSITSGFSAASCLLHCHFFLLYLFSLPFTSESFTSSSTCPSQLPFYPLITTNLRISTPFNCFGCAMFVNYSKIRGQFEVNP